MLHILLRMAQHDEPVTSDVQAQAIDTIPVVSFRIMTPLRDVGCVCYEQGHGEWASRSDPGGGAVTRLEGKEFP